MKIKRLSVMLMTFITCLAVFTSCSDNKKESYLEILSVPNNIMNFDGNTFKKSVYVRSSSEWNVFDTNENSWISSEIDENILVLNLESNTSLSNRNSVLFITNAEGLTTNLSIIQNPSIDTHLSLNKKGDVWTNYHDTELSIAGHSDLDVTIDIKKSNKWVDFIKERTADGFIVNLKFEPNLDKEKREALIDFKTGNKTETIKLIQRGKKGFEDVTHKIYFHFGSFPVLYSALDLVQHSLPSIIFDERNNIDKTKLGPNVKFVHSMSSIPDVFIEEVRKINNSNPDAVFEFVAEEIRSAYSIPIFTQLEVDSSRVKVTMCPDGTAAYLKVYNEIFGDVTEGEVVYKQTQKDFNNYYTELINDPAKGKAITDKKDYKFANWYFPHVFAREGQTRYYIESLDYLISENEFVNEQKSHTNYIIDTPLQILNSLTKEQQRKFYDLVGFNPDEYHKNFQKSPKPNLIILGTNTNASEGRKINQSKYVKKVMDKYSAEYDIFYKAHPADKAYLTYETDFPGLNLILPAKLPFEVFTWALDGDIDAIGGYTTSTFLTMPTDKIKFMFAKDASNMNVLFQQILNGREDIYWIDIE